MSIDYYSCNSCGESFPDVIDYAYCECGKVWCDDECAKEDGFIDEHCKLDYECDSDECDMKYCSDDCVHYVEKSCKYCREEDFDDDTLLEHALELLGFTREQLIESKKSKSE